jgi:hypothetical protein
MPSQGWYPDPSGDHADRWFSAGHPTPLVRDGSVVSREDLPPDQQPGRRDGDGPFPSDLAAARWAAQRSRRFELRAALVVLAAACLFLAWSAISRATVGFELAPSAVVWAWSDRTVQLLAGLTAAAQLFALARRPRWRRASAAVLCGIASLQVGSFALSGAEYPGNSCWAPPGWAAVTLTDWVPRPTLATTPGAHIIATVPGGHTLGGVFDIAASSGVLREDCNIPLAGGGRRTIFTAVKPGTVVLTDSEPATPTFMPYWSAEVTVRGGSK